MECNEKASKTRFLIDLGQRILNERKAHGETQTQLQQAVGVSKRETENQWESGTRSIKAPELYKIAKHYGISADYLLGITTVKTIYEDERIAKETTGLSEESIANIKNINAIKGENIHFGKILMDSINRLLSSEELETELFQIFMFRVSLDKIIKKLSCNESLTIEELEEIDNQLVGIRQKQIELSSELANRIIGDDNIALCEIARKKIAEEQLRQLKGMYERSDTDGRQEEE